MVGGVFTSLWDQEMGEAALRIAARWATPSTNIVVTSGLPNSHEWAVSLKMESNSTAFDCQPFVTLLTSS